MLGASLLEIMLAGKGLIRGGNQVTATSQKGRGVTRAGVGKSNEARKKKNQKRSDKNK